MKYNVSEIKKLANNLRIRSNALSTAKNEVYCISPKKPKNGFYSRKNSIISRISNVQHELNMLSNSISSAADKMSIDDRNNSIKIKNALKGRGINAYSKNGNLFYGGSLNNNGAKGAFVTVNYNTLSHKASSIGKSKKNGDSLSKFGNSIKSGLSKIGKKVKKVASSTYNYVTDSISNLILGDYGDKDITVLSFLAGIGLGILDWDLPLDLRDFAYDTTHFKANKLSSYGNVALDIVAFIPLIGAVKYLKYTDELVDLGKAGKKVAKAAKNTDNAVDAGKSIKKAEKAAEAGQEAKNAKKAEKALESTTDLIKKTELDDLPDNVKDSFKKYNDSGWRGTRADQTPGTRAGAKFNNDPPVLPRVDKNGKNIQYREYDVNNKQSGLKRDNERFVRGSDGSVYYTNNHYVTFNKID